MRTAAAYQLAAPRRGFAWCGARLGARQSFKIEWTGDRLRPNREAKGGRFLVIGRSRGVAGLLAGVHAAGLVRGRTCGESRGARRRLVCTVADCRATRAPALGTMGTFGLGP